MQRQGWGEFYNLPRFRVGSDEPIVHAKGEEQKNFPSRRFKKSDKRKVLLEMLLLTVERNSLLEIANSFEVFFGESLYCRIMTATNLLLKEKDTLPHCVPVSGVPSYLQSSWWNQTNVLSDVVCKKAEFFIFFLCKLAVATLGKCLEYNGAHVCRSRMNCS